MEGRQMPHMEKYKGITNDWNYDASCTLTTLLVWDFENFKRLLFVVQSVHQTLDLSDPPNFGTCVVADKIIRN
jgi:hypothetical protein